VFCSYRSLIFWIYEDPELLMPRLDQRVDRMVDAGLLEEIKALRDEGRRIYGSENVIDHEEGIFQSIGKSTDEDSSRGHSGSLTALLTGYKEFAAIPTDQLSPYHPQFAAALERMKLSTRQYAKKQLKWIRKQLLPAVRKARAEGAEVEVYVMRGGMEDGGPGPSILQSERSVSTVVGNNMVD
jgi:tRNA dimethylallyltransferase